MKYIVKGELVEIEEDQDSFSAIKDGKQLSLLQKVNGWTWVADHGETVFGSWGSKGEAINYIRTAEWETFIVESKK